MKVFNFIKTIAKKSKILVHLYGCFIGIIFLFSPISASKILYRISTGKKLDLENPKGFNEKLMWLKHNWRDPVKTKCSDKLLVREFVKERGCEEILNEIYAVYDNIDEIDWSKLPHQFVLKCTYGSGANIICTNKDKLDIKKAKYILKKGLKIGFLNKTAEFHGDKSTNKIICEKYIDTLQGEVPIDYKVYCFNGKPKIVLAVKDRFKGLKKMFYDTEWNCLEQYANPKVCNGNIEKPENLDLIIFYAKKLSKGFPFVRADFYSDGSRVVFGELTFTPAACLSKAHNALGDAYFGELLKLPPKSIGKYREKRIYVHNKNINN